MKGLFNLTDVAGVVLDAGDAIQQGNLVMHIYRGAGWKRATRMDLET